MMNQNKIPEEFYDESEIYKTYQSEYRVSWLEIFCWTGLALAFVGFGAALFLGGP